MAMRGRLRDWILLLFCNLIWGSQFVVYKIVQRQVGPIFASLFPITCATLFLIPFVYRHRPKESLASERREPLKHDVLRFIVIGVCGQVVAQLGMASGTRLAPASNAALISLVLPIATAFMAYLFLGERMTRIRWIGFGLAILGVIECSGIEWNRLNATNSKVLLGNVILFCAISGSAFYNAYSKTLLIRYSPLQVLCYSYCVVILLMLPIAICTEAQSFHNIPNFTASVWAGFLILAFFQYFLAMVIFLSVLTRLEATQAGLSNYLIPFFGVLIAALVLHERLTPNMVFGGLMVLVATAVVTFGGSEAQSKSIYPA
jgi:drug/metabolite transporter (DMT)-like permease